MLYSAVLYCTYSNYCTCNKYPARSQSYRPGMEGGRDKAAEVKARTTTTAVAATTTTRQMLAQCLGKEAQVGQVRRCWVLRAHMARPIRQPAGLVPTSSITSTSLSASGPVRTWKHPPLPCRGQSVS